MGLSEDPLALTAISMPSKVERDNVIKALVQRDPRQDMEATPFCTGDYCEKCKVKCPADSGRVTINNQYMT